MLRTGRIRINNRTVTLEELSLAQYEAIASDFSPQQLMAGHGGRFNKSLICEAISQLDGQDADDATVRKAFHLSAHWQQLNKAYSKLTGAEEASKQVRLALARRKEAACSEGDSCGLSIRLSDGREVGMRPISADLEEQIDLREGARGERDQAAILHEKIRHSIVTFAGESVEADLFDARLEIPRACDWQTMAACYAALNAAVDVPDFLPDDRDSEPT